MAAARRTLGDDAVIITVRERPGDPHRRYEIDATRGEPDDPPLRGARTRVDGGHGSARARAPVPRSSESPRTLPLPSLPLSRQLGESVGVANHVDDEDAQPQHPLHLAPTPLLPPRDVSTKDANSTSMLERLDRAGLDPMVRGRLIERARRLQRVGEAPTMALRTAFIELMGQSPAPWHVDDGERRVLAFVGPTGVGKTTTVAKVAAQAILARRRVAMITTDTWRVGAAQHLSRYGEIMGVSTYVAHDEGELSAALQHARGFDLTLIDSAGRSPRVQRDPIRWRAMANVEVHLVVPTSTSTTQLAAIRRRHKDDDPVALIATKRDETEDLEDVSCLINAVALLGLPIAATADGQTVPDDIAAFDSASLWRRMGATR
jgi:flagellar biosynthesis protein FlhF